MTNQKVHIAGQDIDNVATLDVLKLVSERVAAKQFAFCVTTNVDHLMKLRRDRGFQEVYAMAALCVADGMPLVWASHFLGTPLKERVNGTDLMMQLSERAARESWSIYLLGGAGDSAMEAAARLQSTFPGLKIAGHYSPPFDFEHDREECARICERIHRSGADVLFVGVGAPKQEKWLAAHGSQCGVAFGVPVGASFSFISGQVPRAPLWMQHNGLEWFWRLMQEPGRLWRRYLVEGLPFFAMIMRQRLGGPVRYQCDERPG